MVDSQETTFVQSDEQRSGKQEVIVLEPRLKKPSEREGAELQSLLDLTDWRGLHLAFTQNLLQHRREWAPPDHSSGSHFRVETLVATQTTPSLPLLERQSWLSHRQPKSTKAKTRTVQQEAFLWKTR
jgi:hypothetical protein